MCEFYYKMTLHLYHYLYFSQTCSVKKINNLLEKSVFKVISISEVPKSIRIFNSHFVDKIKNIGAATAFEKFRLVVQAYNNHGKKMVLTQIPTIQQMSQRLILALSMINPQFDLYLQDIS